MTKRNAPINPEPQSRAFGHLVTFSLPVSPGLTMYLDATPG